MVEQEGALLIGRAEELDSLRGPLGYRPAAPGALGVAALLVVAAFVATGRGAGAGIRSHLLLAPSLAEESCLLTLDVALANLARAKLDSYVGARVALVDGITRAFEGRLPPGQVRAQVEVLAGGEEAASTTVQVTLVPRGNTSAGDCLAAFRGAEEEDTLRVLIAEEANHAEGVLALAEGEVSVSSMVLAPQDGELQLTAADVEAGATVIPMGATKLEEGEVITIMEHRANGLQAEATIVSKDGGDLQVAPALPHAFARGSLVILIPRGHRAVQVTDTAVLENLPASKLDDRMRAEVEQQVRESYAEVLKVRPDQVDAHVKSAEGRRLADGSSSTELEVLLTPAEGQSAADLASAMDASRGELDSAVQKHVQQIPGIGDIALGPIAAVASAEVASEAEATAGEGSEFRQKEGSGVDVSRVAFFGGIVCLGCLASCVAVASILRAKKDAPAEGAGPAQDEVPLATSEAWLGPEPNQPARGPLQLSPPQEEPEESSDQPDESPPLPPPEEAPVEVVEVVQEVVLLPVPVPEDPREELLRKVFAKYDHDGDSVLNESELLAFALAACEFGGSADEWSMEYSAILEELGNNCNNSNGLGIDEFRQLVSDPQLGLSPRTLEDPEAVSALYCSDDDLVRALEVQRGNKELHQP